MIETLVIIAMVIMASGLMIGSLVYETLSLEKEKQLVEKFPDLNSGVPADEIDKYTKPIVEFKRNSACLGWIGLVMGYLSILLFFHQYGKGVAIVFASAGFILMTVWMFMLLRKIRKENHDIEKFIKSNGN